MSGREVERRVRDAREAADWMESLPGGRARAEKVRSMCRSNLSLRQSLSRSCADVRRLHALLPTSRSQVAAAERRAIEMELRTTAGVFERHKAIAETEGVDPAVRVPDVEYLIGLLRRAAEVMP